MGFKRVYESPGVYRFCMCTYESPEKGSLAFFSFSKLAVINLIDSTVFKVRSFRPEKINDIPRTI